MKTPESVHNVLYLPLHGQCIDMIYETYSSALGRALHRAFSDEINFYIRIEIHRTIEMPFLNQHIAFESFAFKAIQALMEQQ